MRPKTMILFVIAIGCGLVASIGVSQYMETSNAKVAVETQKIFVAMSNINIGEKLDAQNVSLEEWPKDRIPDGAIASLEELEDQYPRQRLYPGEPILRAKLMDSNSQGSEALTIPAGYRVVSVKVTVDSAVSGLLQPGDRVDLMVFLRKSKDVPETGTRTILRDVNVFSVDGETERQLEDGQARNVRTVALLVKPQQAETVMLASELGRLSLSLRRPDDTTEVASQGVGIHTLLGTNAEDANEKNDPELRQPSGLSDWLDNQIQQPTAPEEEAPTIMEEEVVWSMQLLTPNGYREFRWRDLEDLPEEFDPQAEQQQQADGASPGGAPDGTDNGPDSGAAEIPAENPAPLVEDPVAPLPNPGEGS